MITEDELDQMTNAQLERERVRDAILKLEIEQLKKAVEQIENVSGIRTGEGTGSGA